MKPWFEALQCPHCRAPLSRKDGHLACSGERHIFPLRDEIPVFLDDMERGKVLDTQDGRIMSSGYRNPARLLNSLRWIISSEFFPGKAWRQARERALVGEDSPLLVIGSGVSRYANAVHLDLDDFPGVDVVADAHEIPFRENTFRGAICEVVLEHVARPERVIAETYRVLKPGGRFFFIVPFLFPYHGHPGDYRRWSRQGLEADFAAFEQIETGIHGGPCSSMVNLLTEWIYILSGLTFPKGYVGIKGAATALLFPIKFLDYAVNRFPEAHRLASTLFITGIKPGTAS